VQRNFENKGIKRQSEEESEEECESEEFLNKNGNMVFLLVQSAKKIAKPSRIIF
jgi:hypothetical protein